MRRSRSHLNNLASSQRGGQGVGNQPHMPIGANQQTNEIQRRLSAIGMQPQQAMPEMYAPAPQPAAQQAYTDTYARPAAPQNNQQIEHIRASLEQMGAKIKALGQQNNTPAPQLQHTQALVRQNEQITAELLEMRKLLAHMNNADSSADLRAEMEAIRQALETSHSSISQQLSNSESVDLGAERLVTAVETGYEQVSRDLAHSLNTIRESLDNVSGDTDFHNKTLEARHDEVANRISHLQDSVNTVMGNPEHFAETVENSHRDLVRHFAELKDSMASVERASGNIPIPDFSSVEMRLEEITRAVVALSASNSGVDNLDRIEARISDIAKTVTSLQPGDSDTVLARIEAELADLKIRVSQPQEPVSAFDQPTFDQTAFDMQMQEVRQTLSELSQNVSQTNHMPEIGFSGIADQINRLSEKLDNRSVMGASESGEGSVDQSALLERLDALVAQVGEIKSAPVDLITIGSMIENGPGRDIGLKLDAVTSKLDVLYNKSGDPLPESDNSQAFASLEGQLSEILTHLTHVDSNPQEAISFEPIAERLAGIEQQLSASRDIAIEVATQAAEEAVQRTISELPAISSNAQPSDAAAINALSEDLKRWHDSLTDKNSENFETFDSVRESLSLMAERLSQIEESMNSGGAYLYGATEETAAPQGFAAVETRPEQTHSGSKSVLDSVFSAQASHEEPQYEPQQEITAEATAEMPAAYTQEAQVQVDPHYSPEVTHEVAQVPMGEAINPLFAAAVSEANRHNADTSAPLPRVETPSLDIEHTHGNSSEGDMVEDDMPLEPGSGAPDLAALVRQANERRKSNAKNDAGSSGNDFLASARRAAQAAAHEASLVQDDIMQPKSESLFASLPSLIAKRKKVLMMGGAAILLAAIAVPLAGYFLGGENTTISNNSQTPVIEQSAAPASDSVVADATPASGPATIETVEEGGAEPVVVVPAPTIEQSSNEAQISENLGAVAVNGDSVQAAEASVIATPVSVTSPDIASAPVATIPAIDVSGVNFGTPQLKTAASNADATALFEIGRRYSEGAGTTKNLQEAAIWYERSAELGYVPAQYIVGNFNEKAIGVERNIPKAVSWYKLAAEGGNIVAMHNLGVLYATPNAVEKQPNMESAFRWFREAAEYGVRDSQVNMGIFYTKGIGTEVNLIDAYKWFAIAAAGGDKDAASKLAIIQDALRPDQLEAAKAIVDSWAPLTAIEQANDVKIPDNWKAPQAQAKAAPVSKQTIAQMQAVLTKLGYNAGPADGVMGQKTRTAISNYRKSAGLAVNENIDAELLRSLTAAISG